MKNMKEVFKYIGLFAYMSLPYLLVYYLAIFSTLDKNQNELFLLLACVSGIAINGCIIYLLYRKSQMRE